MLAACNRPAAARAAFFVSPWPSSSTVVPGSGPDRRVSVTIYLTGRRYGADVNRVYAEILGAHRPARAVIPVPEIKPGCLIEIQAVGTTGAP